MATETPDPTDIHYQTVSQRVPRRLLDTPAEQRQALRGALAAPMPWLEAARTQLPEVLTALQDEYRQHQAHARVVGGFLAQVPSAEAFAEPLLRQALKDRFGLDLDLRRTFLFNAVRARVAESHIATADPVVRAFQAVKAGTQSLLLSALQNFEAFEAADGGLRDGLRPSRIFTSDNGLVTEAATDVDLAPERFAALCRTLDLGGRYQRLIDQLFQPEPLAGESVEAAAINRQGRFKLFEQSSLRLSLHLARLQSRIDQACYEELLEVAKNGKASGDLERSLLSLWDVELTGIVLFFRPGRLVVYMPDEPEQPVQVFDHLQAFHASLRERLKDPAWRNYFLRFIPARAQASLMQRLQRTLYPKVWNPGGWYDEQFDPNASLGLGKQAFATPLFNVLLQRKMAALRDDGLFHVVPTAVQDHKSTQDKIDYFLGLGFNLLNAAAFVVPVLGEVMLGVNAALLGYEVYEGFDSLAKGEREQAWGYFMDVAENLAIIAALGVVGAAAHRFPGNLPLAVRSMRPVTLGDGSVRLWKPDLSPFAYEVRLPAGLQADAQGLYSFQGRRWLSLDGRYYSVRTLLGEEGYRLEHPTRVGAYEPALRHNGNGGWLHELDTPERWRGMQLFARQGPLEARVSEDMARQALRISGVSEAELRQTLVASQRPPALLTDSLRRLALAQTSSAETFAADYQTAQAPLSRPAAVLHRRHPLPHVIAEEIVAAATADELDELTRAARVPLRLADEARLYQQQVRIARACEGLVLDREISLDSARLMLHALETLPDWPKHLRLGLYDGWIEGPRLMGIGEVTAPELGVIWDRQLPGEFCRVLFDNIPAVYRERLGLTDAATLWRKLQAQRLAPRQRLREWLGMPPIKPAFRSPMRLADGRIGLPLSGNGQGFFTEDELLDKLRILELDDVYVEDVLQALYRRGLDRAAINLRLNGLLDEMQALRASLDRWALESANENLSARRQHSRERIGLALWEHWRRSILPELGQPPSRLILSQVQLADLPDQLPAFFRDRVQSLLLDDVAYREGAPHQVIIGENQVQELALRFPDLTRLEIQRGEWSIGLAQMIARAWPRLRALSLREVRSVISHQDMRTLATLEQLRWLDLRAMNTMDMGESALDGMTLDYLGLDWLGLESWPVWLHNEALARIGEVSLQGNRLSEVPTDILNNSEATEAPTRIVLLGNRLQYQALLDARLAERLQRRFTFDLGLSRTLDVELDSRVVEIRQLQDACRAWARDPVQGPLVPGVDQVAYRNRIARTLLLFWREELRGGGATLLSLEDVVLSNFPGRLPRFFYERVTRLDLTRFTGNRATLASFVRRFPQLIELSLVAGRPLRANVPEFLTEMPCLREVALVRMGLTIDQAAISVLARIPSLASLQLDGNRLGEITDMSGFNQRHLSFLGLAEMQISTWPEWLNAMVPIGTEQLNLDDNQLTTLPEFLLENHRMPDGSVEISLLNNPLTRDTMIRAHASQHYNRPYSFSMDLPEDILMIAPESHPSDSEGLSAEEDALSEDEADNPWSTGDAGQDARNLQVHDRLVAGGDAGSLLELIARLRHSADYRNRGTRGELAERVWNVLLAADQDVELRLALNGMAEEPLQQLHQHETCPDGIRLEFNQMELQVHTRQALRQIGEENRGPALFRLMRGIFRASTLDRIAREQAMTRDEAEVRLAYRLRWAAQLELPLPPRSMLFRSVAEVTPGELSRALNQVLTEEAGPQLARFGAQCDFWVAYLREAFAERFKALKDGYEAEVLAVTSTSPGQTPEQMAAQITALEEKFKRDEQALLESLTFEQALTRP